MTDYMTKPLTARTWDDFAALVEAHNGVWGGCLCMGFHPEGFSSTPEGNCETKRPGTCCPSAATATCSWASR